MPGLLLESNLVPTYPEFWQTASSFGPPEDLLEPLSRNEIRDHAHAFAGAWEGDISEKSQMGKRVKA